MGVILPHGGIEVKQFANPMLQWSAGSFRIGVDIPPLEVEAGFAEKGDIAGYLTLNALVTPLLLVRSRQGPLEWQVRLDGLRPAGMPQYFFTENTLNALQNARQVTDEMLLIDGICYYLHAAYHEGLHLALLIRVDE
jgi:hypothetical protein